VIQEYLSEIGVVVDVVDLARKLTNVGHVSPAGEEVVLWQTDVYNTLTAFCEGPCAHNQEYLVRPGQSLPLALLCEADAGCRNRQRPM
jgi:hypothetical protein